VKLLIFSPDLTVLELSNQKSFFLINQEDSHSKLFECQVDAYQLRVFQISALSHIDSFNFIIEPQLQSEIISQTESILMLFNQALSQGINIPGITILLEKLPIALKEQRYAWIRRVLSSYVVRKCQELLLK
jgi:hypothetical protein